MALYLLLEVVFRPAGRKTTSRSEIRGLCTFCLYKAIVSPSPNPQLLTPPQHHRRHRMRRQLNQPAVAAIALHRQRRRRHAIGRSGAVAGAWTVGRQQLAGGVLGHVGAHQAHAGRILIMPVDQCDRKPIVGARGGGADRAEPSGRLSPWAISTGSAVAPICGVCMRSA